MWYRGWYDNDTVVVKRRWVIGCDWWDWMGNDDIDIIEEWLMVWRWDDDRFIGDVRVHGYQTIEYWYTVCI